MSWISRITSFPSKKVLFLKLQFNSVSMVLAGHIHWFGKITQRERIESKRRSIVYKLQYEVDFGHLRCSNNQLQRKDKSQAPSYTSTKKKKRQSGAYDFPFWRSEVLRRRFGGFIYGFGLSPLLLEEHSHACSFNHYAYSSRWGEKKEALLLRRSSSPITRNEAIFYCANCTPPTIIGHCVRHYHLSAILLY